MNLVTPDDNLSQTRFDFGPIYNKPLTHHGDYHAEQIT